MLTAIIGSTVLGGNNELVGHRRWFLFPSLSNVATGDTGRRAQCVGTGCRANAIAVLCNGCLGGERTDTPQDIVLWPSAVFTWCYAVV